MWVWVRVWALGQGVREGVRDYSPTRSMPIEASAITLFLTLTLTLTLTVEVDAS